MKKIIIFLLFAFYINSFSASNDYNLKSVDKYDKIDLNKFLKLNKYDKKINTIELNTFMAVVL